MSVKNQLRKTKKSLLSHISHQLWILSPKILRDNEISCIKLDGKVDGRDREVVVNAF